MANKISNVGFDQIPHLVTNHEKTDPYHYVIMTSLFKVLKDNKYCIYSDEKLSQNTKIPIRTISKKLNDLEEWSFIKREGNGYNRKFYLGIAFDIDQIKTNSARGAGYKLNNSAPRAETSADKGKTSGTTCRDYNKLIKDITKDIFPSSTSTPKHPPYTENEDELVRKYKHGLKYPRFRLEGNELIKAKALFDRHN